MCLVDTFCKKPWIPWFCIISLLLQKFSLLLTKAFNTKTTEMPYIIYIVKMQIGLFTLHGFLETTS